MPLSKIYTAADVADALRCGLRAVYRAAEKLNVGTLTEGGTMTIFTADDVVKIRAAKPGKGKAGRPRKLA